MIMRLFIAITLLYCYLAFDLRTKRCRLTMRSIDLTPLDSEKRLNDVYFYNTLTRQKEKFVAINAPKITFYSCGPTVYDYAHIGNFRAFLTYDLIKRWLLYSGYDVDHVCNLTDVDDKIIVKMNADGKTLAEITEKYASAFFADLKVDSCASRCIFNLNIHIMSSVESLLNILCFFIIYLGAKCYTS